MVSYRANGRYASAWQAGVRDFRAHESRSLPGEYFCVHWQLPRTSLRVCRARWYYPPRGACAAAVRNLSCRRRRQAAFHDRSVSNLQRGDYLRACGLSAVSLRLQTSSMRPPHTHSGPGSDGCAPYSPFSVPKVNIGGTQQGGYHNSACEMPCFAQLTAVIRGYLTIGP